MRASLSASRSDPAVPSEVTIHASCVAFDGKGVLIKGKSGSGKSSLALQLMAFGAQLVADDRVVLTPSAGVRASAPAALKGMIEARNIGILNADHAADVQVACVIDLNEVEDERLPPHRTITLMGTDIPLFYKVEGLHFAPAILQFLRAGRMAT